VPLLPLLYPYIESSIYTLYITILTIALHTGLSLAIIMERYKGPLTLLNLALHRGLYLDIIMDRYEGPLAALTLALHRGL
jgi:hypothetical protein